MKLFFGGTEIGKVTEIVATKNIQKEIKVLPDKFEILMKPTYINKELIQEMIKDGSIGEEE